MKRNTVLFSLCLSCSLSIYSLSAQSDIPYKDPKLSIDQRVADLLGRMTLEEKVGQLKMKSLNKLKLDKKGAVTDSSLVALFGGRALVAWKARLLSMRKWLLIRKRLTFICVQRLGWAFLPSRLPRACTGTWR